MNGENYYMKEFIANILRGMVIGISNVIPGVSGGTMMVSMGIYDKLILVLTHFIKRMKEAVALLVPIVIGMLLSIAIFAKIFSEILFPKFPLQTNLFFIGLIIGGLPVIYKRVKGNTIRLPQIIAFIVLFVVVVGFALVGEGSGSSVDVNFSVGNILKLFGVGVIAAATMVIPGVSGSMVMMILGYYNTIIDTINAFVNALKAFDIGAMLNTFIVLIPFGIGVVVGIVAVAKLIEFLLEKYPLITYWAIIGLIAASPFAILIMMDVATVGVVEIISGLVLLVLGFFISMKLGA
jgi:putative membrane protein